MKTLSIVLGSGFSYHSGLPLAMGINSYFTRNNIRQLLHFSSDEWKWFELASEVEQHNGSISYDIIAYSYILNELVSVYIEQQGTFKNYEEFYQFVIDGLKESNFLQDVFKKAHEKFENEEEVHKENQFYNVYTRTFQHPDRKQVYSMINHLIGDLLYWRKPLESFKNKYDPFISYISEFERVETFTLNHDLLFEALMRKNSINYSDGFSIENSRLQTEKGKKIVSFNGKFDLNINLFKLHGSIDLYQFICADQKGSILNPTGELIYFKTHDYDEKQNPVRIDLATGKVVQDFHWNITPQFVTGTKKEELIKKDKMYNALYKELYERIPLSNTLLVIGYSYKDYHINKQIKRAITFDNLENIININPSELFPYNDTRKNIINMYDISEL